MLEVHLSSFVYLSGSQDESCFHVHSLDGLEIYGGAVVDDGFLFVLCVPGLWILRKNDGCSNSQRGDS